MALVVGSDDVSWDEALGILHPIRDGPRDAIVVEGAAIVFDIYIRVFVPCIDYVAWNKYGQRERWGPSDR
jgi:hypothetical protein